MAYIAWEASKLIDWGMTMDKNCVYCHMHEEIRDHLFLQFQDTKFVWDAKRRKNHRAIYQRGITCVVDQQAGQREITGNSDLQACLYSIWIERNTCIFGKKQKNN
ncbi:hypothetical protein AABB24_012506 [Solanum stoloniferum]|uniref:Reverse transcriptase zinc-binding domain-containing protein n=1 Tax=Solanum stoloniferum TaxID=62892 RepID=A0ABD2U3Z6_9SOLN